jgi:O-antigen/teichoic acid export membrane protein
VALTYGASVGGSVLSLGSVLITSRALGPSGRGTVVFLTTVAMLTAQLATLGVEEAAANLAGSRPGLRGGVATNALLLAAVLGIVGAAVVAGLIALVPHIGGHTSASLRWLALGAIPVLILQYSLQFLARADYAYAIANASTLVGPLVNVAVNGLLYALGLITVGTALATWVVGQVIATGWLVAYVAKRLGGFGRPDARLARGMLAFGIKAHGGRVMMTGNYRLDQWILGAIAGPRELGLYSVAVAWTQVLFFLPDALSLVLRPDLIRASAREAGRRTAAVFRAAMLLTLPLVVGTVLAAPILCVTVFGPSFRGSIDDLRVLATGAFGMVALKVIANALLAQGRPMLNNIAIAIAFAVTLGLDILLIPSHGGLGAAIASTASYTSGGIAASVICTRSLSVGLRDLIPRVSDLRRMLRSAGPAHELG